MERADIHFKRWLKLYEALDPNIRVSLDKKAGDNEALKKAIEDMDAEPELITTPDAWKRFNAAGQASGGAGKDKAAMEKLASIMPRGTEGMEEYIQMWRAGRMSAPELYSLAFFAARGANRNSLSVLAREMTSLPENWRKRINFSMKPQISTPNGLAEYERIEDFSQAVHSLAATDLDLSDAARKLEFDPKTDIDPARWKDKVVGGGDKGIWVYKGPDPTLCRLYGKGGRSKDSPHESPWCVAQTSNSSHYFDYRIDRGQSFYFIFDTHKASDDPARRVLAGVSLNEGESEWSDMNNHQRINGYSNVEQYKKYLAGKLGVSVQELDEKLKPEPITDAERRLKGYLDDYANATN